ncbi:hypothetical protein CPB83DRAFT_513748 [Crepidotus variabilis]|uniref:DUF6533 domain-containing protein n=1 Tax=Crepidotus variabilis TaxID=179855 RepID=A0A9P6EAH1_9AGAR|nr:hypothetical protein CPB83DRAFT_513748 [Crepidotus variabilis]
MSTATLDYSNMPNPLAPEVWMPYPSDSFRIYASVAMGTFAVLVWDILSSLPDEIRLLSQHRFRLSTLCYCIARVAPLPFMAVQNILLTTDTNHCRSWAFAGGLCFACIHIPAGLLFLFRVRAVYNSLPRFKLVFSLLWVVYAGCCLLPFFGIAGTRVLPLRRCIAVFRQPYPVILFFTQAAYDLVVCAAVTYKISSDVRMENKDLKLGWSLRLRNNPFFKLRARFLVDSHAYFIITFFLKFAEIVVYFAGNPIVLLIFTLFDNIFISIIACKIYRQFRLGKSGLLNHSYELTTFGLRETGQQKGDDVQEISRQE